MGELLSRNIYGEQRAEYHGEEPTANADIRRLLYLVHGVSPSKREAGEQPRDIWQEAASRLDHLKGGPLVDLGTSSGYFIEKLLERGHQGPILGYDLVTKHFPLLQEYLRGNYGHIGVHLRKGDAANFNSLQIPENYAKAGSGLFLANHMGRPHHLATTLHRAVEPGGLVLLGGRGEDNLRNLWQIAQVVAAEFNASMPKHNFYHHFPLRQHIESIQNSRKFKILDIIWQNNVMLDNIYLQGTPSSFDDFADAVGSYLPLTRKRNGKPLLFEEVEDFIYGPVKEQYFDTMVDQFGYFPDRINQAIIIAENIK